MRCVVTRPITIATLVREHEIVEMPGAIESTRDHVLDCLVIFQGQPAVVTIRAVPVHQLSAGIPGTALLVGRPGFPLRVHRLKLVTLIDWWKGSFSGSPTIVGEIQIFL